MRQVIEHLRERPEDERHAVAMFSAVVVVAVLLLGWGAMSISALNASRGAQTAAAAQAAESASSAQPATPSVSIDSIKKAYEAEVQKMKDIQQAEKK